MAISKNPIWLTVIVAELMTVTVVWAGDAPTSGILYNTREVSSLTYQCRSSGTHEITCNFVQASVRHKLKTKDIEAKLKEARAEFANNKDELLDKTECKKYQKALDDYKERNEPPEEGALDQLGAMQKGDAIRQFEAVIEHCASGNEASFVKLVRMMLEKDARTCKVSTNPFEATLRFVQDYAADKSAWVTKDSPSGPCGLVQLSRFEYDDEHGFWRYVARKAVTNPAGTVLPGFSCTEMDESEYLYDWRSPEHALGCDYMVFSVL